ncbi:hypothetical protein PR048_024343 [Dryococelus australis]|uniref:Uncharacterized protein n=1 Tax=Dryococelus australis TaxID=614101 RepID=A0ABQ9GNB2_9NEOP|nr:hypothetical protein PR048_024343 [Dryococelus australis]
MQMMLSPHWEMFETCMGTTIWLNSKADLIRETKRHLRHKKYATLENQKVQLTMCPQTVCIAG